MLSFLLRFACGVVFCGSCVVYARGAEGDAAAALLTEEAAQQQKEIGRWADVVAWTHSWDALDATTYEDDGRTWSAPAATRVDTVADRGANNRPLVRDNGTWGTILGVARIPGPKLVPRAPQFNGRPAWRSDKIGPGGFGGVFTILSPMTDPRDEKTWFNAPKGYDAPYWGAVLCRPADPEQNFAAWDGFNGETGTIVTLGRGLFTKNWGATTSLGLGDPWPSTKVAISEHQTVLVLAQVDGENSFLEFHQRDAEGKLKTERAPLKLTSHPAKDVFFGYVHHSFVSAAGLKTGPPAEEDLKKVRTWAEPWLVPYGPLPLEP